jgi:RNA polymerase sigma factor
VRWCRLLFSSLWDKSKKVDDHLLLQQAKEGNEQARNELIEKYKPFILKQASKACGRFINPANDDEYSVAMIAFNEAINKFDFEKNISLLSFAETVIKRRLIDHFRKETTHRKVIPISALENDDLEQESVLNQIEAESSRREYQKKSHAEDLREEIQSYEKFLNQFDITFLLLTEISPKHQDARERAMEVARYIANDTRLTQHLTVRKELPVKAVLEGINISRKTLERQRKYIIALVLILTNDFTYLRGYIKNL